MGVEVRNITKSFGDFKALDDVSLRVEAGELVALLGPSGSGKTTLLNSMSGLDKITKGKIYFGDKLISKYSDRKITKFRKENIGFIFQTYNLLEHLNVYENVLSCSSFFNRQL